MISSKQRTLLNEIREQFHFLIDFGFELLETNNNTDKLVVIYCNNSSELQIEFAGLENYFHCELRRLIEGQPAKYSDHKNSIGFEDLALLENKGDYDHFQYYPPSVGWKKVVKNTAELLKRNTKLLNTKEWVDIEQIDHIKDQLFEKKFGMRPTNGAHFFQRLKEETLDYLKSKEFELIIDSTELPPYDSASLTNHIELKRNEKTLTIGQSDWRDNYYIYRIDINGRTEYEIDISKNRNTAMDQIINKLKMLIE